MTQGPFLISTDIFATVNRQQFGQYRRYLTLRSPQTPLARPQPASKSPWISCYTSAISIVSNMMAMSLPPLRQTPNLPRMLVRRFFPSQPKQHPANDTSQRWCALPTSNTVSTRKATARRREQNTCHWPTKMNTTDTLMGRETSPNFAIYSTPPGPSFLNRILVRRSSGRRG